MAFEIHASGAGDGPVAQLIEFACGENRCRKENGELALFFGWKKRDRQDAAIDTYKVFIQKTSRLSSFPPVPGSYPIANPHNAFRVTFS